MMRFALVLVMVLSTLGAAVADNLTYPTSELAKKVAWGRSFFGADRPYDGHLAALAAMEYTVGRINAMSYGYRVAYGLQLPVGGPTNREVADSSLGLECGSCGNAEAVLETLLRGHGYQVRKIDCYYGSANHTFVEVSFGNRWHAYDGTWGYYWQVPGRHWSDTASAVEVAAAGAASEAWRVENRTHYWNTILGQIGARSAYAWWSAPRLTIKTGSTTLYSR